MQNTRSLRYLLFACMFALVIVGIIMHSYVLLVALTICGLIIGIVGDFIENRPTNRYRTYNTMHDRHGKDTHG